MIFMDLNRVAKILEEFGIESEEILENILRLAIHVLAVKDVMDDVLDTIDLYCEEQTTEIEQ